MREGQELNSEGSDDQCATISPDARRMVEFRPRTVAVKDDIESNLGAQQNIGFSAAGLLSEGLQRRLKDSLEHFTRQQQELVKLSGKDSREHLSPETPSSRPFTSPVASLACMGPAARELAEMIHASQQRAHIGDFKSQFGNEEDGAPGPSSWMQLQGQQAYQDYWRSPGHYAQWSQRHLSQGDQSSSQGFRRPVVHPFWGTFGPHIIPSMAQNNEMDPASQADLTRSIQMLQEAQRLSALASCQIQEVYQNANDKKRKAGDSEFDQDPRPSRNPRPDPRAELPALQALFPSGAEQKCSICGAFNTPVWRRIDKALVCNACGLRKRRLVKKTKDGRNSPQANGEETNLHENHAAIPVTEV